ncbi:MAG: hypothetical protein Q7U59_08395 [Lutibacter sp.]|nr:hypothetical protein [Lutibacter sp.]
MDFLPVESEKPNRKGVFQFKFSTNRESSDFLQIETENQNRK